jgi:ABC-2 type transport system ATP-binding protein
LAASLGIAVHELTPQTASLEEAFMELTRDSVEFHGEGDPLTVPAGSLSTSGEDMATDRVHQELRP